MDSSVERDLAELGLIRLEIRQGTAFQVGLKLRANIAARAGPALVALRRSVPQDHLRSSEASARFHVLGVSTWTQPLSAPGVWQEQTCMKHISQHYEQC
eukprot:1334641-Amorphochlora_amoeboformis.AAC.1